MFARASLLLGLAAAADVSLRGSLAGGDCKTVSPLAELNITEYLRATWYSQQQQLTPYQPASELFCVSATYNDEPDRTVPFFDGFVASTYNYATKQNVSGEPANTKDGMVLCARQQDPKVQGGLVCIARRAGRGSPLRRVESFGFVNSREGQLKAWYSSDAIG